MRTQITTKSWVHKRTYVKVDTGQKNEIFTDKKKIYN